MRNALDAIEAARRANRRPAASGTTWLTCRSCTRTTSRGSPALGATANIQPLWATHEPQMDELTIPFLGERRSGWQYPFRALQAAGGGAVRGQRLAGEQPQPAVGRARGGEQEPARQAPGGHGRATRSCPSRPQPGRRSSPPTPRAAPGSTAWTTVTGSIRTGLDADFAIVDADLSHLAGHEICQAAVTATWVRGQVAYQQ